MDNQSSAKVYYDLNSKVIESTTKIKIIEEAIELFSRNGFSGASIRDITKEVGIKESSLYKHFKNKDEILETILDHFRRATDKILPPMEYLDQIAATMSLGEFLGRGWLNFKEHIQDPIHQKIWRIVYIELFRHPKAKDIYMQGILKRTVECLEQVFGKMMEHHKMAPNDPGLLAMEYQYPAMTLILEFNIQQAEGQSTEAIERRIESHIQFFSRTFGPVTTQHSGE
jgi:AcrR family transcriptional regulator